MEIRKDIISGVDLEVDADWEMMSIIQEKEEKDKWRWVMPSGVWGKGCQLETHNWMSLVRTLCARITQNIFGGNLIFMNIIQVDMLSIWHFPAIHI